MSQQPDRNRQKCVASSLCVPGPGDQKIMGHYLSELSRERLEVMRDRKLTIRLRYEGTTSNELHVRHDVLLGSIGRTAFSSLKSVRVRYRHGQDLSRGGLVSHSITMPILPASTIFAEGDIIEHMFPFGSDGPLTTALSRRRFVSQPAWGTLGAPVR